MKPLFPANNVKHLVCGKVDRKPLPTFPQTLRRLLLLMSPKKGHLYFGE